MQVVTSPAHPLDLSKYIDTHFFGERPHIRNRRVPVATIAHNAITHHLTAAEVADEFGLSVPEVLAALLYYEEHKEAIEEQETAYQAELNEMYRLYGNPED